MYFKVDHFSEVSFQVALDDLLIREVIFVPQKNILVNLWKDAQKDEQKREEHQLIPLHMDHLWGSVKGKDVLTRGCFCYKLIDGGGVNITTVMFLLGIRRKGTIREWMFLYRSIPEVYQDDIRGLTISQLKLFIGLNSRERNLVLCFIREHGYGVPKADFHLALSRLNLSM